MIPPPRYDLDGPLFTWGRDEEHAFTLRQALMGTVCFGATGAGKSSAVLWRIQNEYLRNSRAIPGGMGAVIFLNKPEDLADWMKAIRKAGRESDARIFGPGRGLTYDPFQDEAAHGTEDGGQILNTALLISEISIVYQRAIGMQATGSGGEGKYWEDGLQTLVISLLLLIVTAREKFTIQLAAELAASAPRELSDFESRKWLDESPLAKLLARLAEEYPDERGSERRADIDLIFRQWTEWAARDNRPRSIVYGMWQSLSGKILMQPLRPLFTGGGTNLRPEDCCDGKLILVDMPIQQYKAAGVIAAQIWKYQTQKMIMRRSGPVESRRPVAIFADEFQTMVTPSDCDAQALLRSGGGASVYLTQSVESLRRELGQETTDVLLSNLQTKIFAQNTGATNHYASNLIGSRYEWVTGHTGGGTDSLHDASGSRTSGTTAGINRTQQLRPYILPSRFQSLRNGGPLNKRQVDAVVFCGGKLFKGEGGEMVPFKVLTFRQPED